MKDMTKTMVWTALILLILISLSFAVSPSKTATQMKTVPGKQPGMTLAKLPDLVAGGQQSGPYPFCAIDSQGKLVILVKNQGNADAPASSTSVVFFNGNSIVLPTPPVPKNGLVPLDPIMIPKACYSPSNNYDCNFNITVDSNKQIAELNENNNSSAGKCAPPCKADVKLSAGTQAGQFSGTGSIGISVRCPTMIFFTGRITVTDMKVSPVTLKYQFVRSNGTFGPIKSLVFNALGTQEVSETRGISSTMGVNGEWEQLKIIEPLVIESNKAEFRVTCTGQ